MDAVLTGRLASGNVVPLARGVVRPVTLSMNEPSTSTSTLPALLLRSSLAIRVWDAACLCDCVQRVTASARAARGP